MHFTPMIAMAINNANSPAYVAEDAETVLRCRRVNYVSLAYSTSTGKPLAAYAPVITSD